MPPVGAEGRGTMDEQTFFMVIHELVNIYNAQESDTPVKDMSMGVAELLDKLGYYITDNPDDDYKWIAVKKD